jgi:hypothetical protein
MSRIEIKPSGKKYDIVVPLRLSRENEWLKWGALLGSIFDSITSLANPVNVVQKFKGVKELYDNIKKLPDDLNLGGRKLKRELEELVKAFENLQKSNDPFAKKIFEKAILHLKWVDIKEKLGYVSYTIFMQYESDEFHPLQFLFYITLANPKASFFPSLIFLRTYDFSKYTKEYTYRFRYRFNKRVNIPKAKNEQEARNIALKMLFKPAYMVDMQPKISVQKARKGWDVQIDEVLYTVKMRYIEGTIAEEVLSKVGELLPALPPYQVVKINNINGVELLKASIEPTDIELLAPKTEAQKKASETPEVSKDQISIKPVGSGIPLTTNPNPWPMLAGVGIVGWFLLNKEKKGGEV